ncbi:hypothetical protein [Caballeronia sp. RCC_10]|jgi:predicted porin|uniref:hypothetical protein n=1 Tax=Caballeronia sp. RCC_10 TaxID=3239227 RepID=UPI00352563BF
MAECEAHLIRLRRLKVQPSHFFVAKPTRGQRMGRLPLSNFIKYLSPIFGGFRVSALFSHGGVAGDFSNGKTESVALSYANGSFSAVALFSRINNPATSLYDATAQPGRWRHVQQPNQQP